MHPDLSQPPHVLTHLVDLFSSEVAAPLDAPVDHLIACSYCRGLMAVFAQAIEEVEEAHHHYTQHSAYAETVVLCGTTEAGRCYPGLVAHLEGCSSCQEAVADVLAFLRE